MRVLTKDTCERVARLDTVVTKVVTKNDKAATMLSYHFFVFIAFDICGSQLLLIENIY